MVTTRGQKAPPASDWGQAMSKVYKCDRCGDYTLSTHKLSNPGVFRFGRKYHLCAECERSFRRWFWEGKQERKAREEATNKLLASIAEEELKAREEASLKALGATSGE